MVKRLQMLDVIEGSQVLMVVFTDEKVDRIVYVWLNEIAIELAQL